MANDALKAFTAQLFNRSQAASMSDVDAKFLQDMIVHHQAALGMSEKYLKADPAKRLTTVSDLARGIIAAQTSEIAKMEGWLAESGRPTKSSGMSGMNM